MFLQVIIQLLRYAINKLYELLFLLKITANPLVSAKSKNTLLGNHIFIINQNKLKFFVKKWTLIFLDPSYKLQFVNKFLANQFDMEDS